MCVSVCLCGSYIHTHKWMKKVDVGSYNLRKERKYSQKKDDIYYCIKKTKINVKTAIVKSTESRYYIEMAIVNNLNQIKGNTLINTDISGHAIAVSSQDHNGQETNEITESSSIMKIFRESALRISADSSPVTMNKFLILKRQFIKVFRGGTMKIDIKPNSHSHVLL